MGPDRKIGDRNMKIETSGHGKARRQENPLPIVPGPVRLSFLLFLSLIFLSNPFFN